MTIDVIDFTLKKEANVIFYFSSEGKKMNMNKSTFKLMSGLGLLFKVLREFRLGLIQLCGLRWIEGHTGLINPNIVAESDGMIPVSSEVTVLYLSDLTNAMVVKSVTPYEHWL